VIVAAVYVLAALCGGFIYTHVSGQLWLRVFSADAGATVLVFIFSCIFGNASVYDPYWSVQPIVILAPFAFSSPSPSKSLLMLMVLVWGIRLTANWAYTFGGLEHQDWRYTQLRQSSGKLYPLVNFAGIHMFPTVVVFLCILPALYVMNENPAFSPMCIIGAAISFGAVLLQLVADTQMHRYRKDRRTPFMEQGLWKKARHPNYLGEILMWWGVAIYGIALLGFRWYLILGAAVNHLMFLFISVPLADRRQAKREGYEQYREGKNMLVPIRFR
jgi:steroid 5-alpha reductase family enzyme